MPLQSWLVWRSPYNRGGYWDEYIDADERGPDLMRIPLIASILIASATLDDAERKAQRRREDLQRRCDARNSNSSIVAGAFVVTRPDEHKTKESKQ